MKLQDVPQEFLRAWVETGEMTLSDYLTEMVRRELEERAQPEPIDLVPVK